MNRPDYQCEAHHLFRARTDLIVSSFVRRFQKDEQDYEREKAECQALGLPTSPPLSFSTLRAIVVEYPDRWVSVFGRHGGAYDYIVTAYAKRFKCPALTIARSPKHIHFFAADMRDRVPMQGSKGSYHNSCSLDFQRLTELFPFSCSGERLAELWAVCSPAALLEQYQSLLGICLDSSKLDGFLHNHCCLKNSCRAGDIHQVKEHDR